jgi:hypothetical protein
MFDLHDVMTIVLYDPSDPYTVTTSNLYNEYMNLTSKQVALSNQWYNTYPDHPTNPWFRDNLVYLLDQLSSNCEPSFLQQCLDLYEGFEPVQQGGPLLYWIIQHQLMSTSRLAVDRLTHQITNLKISNIPGENVDTAIALI